MSFLESPRFPDNIGMNSSGGPQYNTEVVVLRSGFEQRNARWTYPLHTYDVASGVKTDTDLGNVIQFFNSVRGRLIGFRYKDWTDYQSAPIGDAITPTDQTIGTGDGSITDFQLIKTYAAGSVTQDRLINKPVPGSTVVAIGGVADNNFVVDNTSGVVSFASDNELIITDITQASHGQISTSTNHNLEVGNTVFFSGIAGMTQLNNIRGKISSIVSDTEFEVLINTNLFDEYTSGGQINTIPQSGEIVSAGFEFDVPCRFDADKLSIGMLHHSVGTYTIPIVEMRLANAPGGGPYVTYAVDFNYLLPDYIPTYLKRNQNLVSVTNGSQGIFSGWFRFDEFEFNQNNLLDNQNGTGFLTIHRNDNDNIRFDFYDADGDAYFGFESNSSFDDDSEWHHILCSWDTNFESGSKVAHLYIDGEDELNITDDDSDAFDIGYESTNWFIGTDVYESYPFIGCMAEFYFAPNQFLDFSIASNRLKFRNAFDKPVLLGADGSYPTGVTPAIYLKNLVLTFANNLGSGGNFSVNGQLTGCSSSPTDDV
jgi:uncharacterized protein (TIGR02217 family)